MKQRKKYQLFSWLLIFAVSESLASQYRTNYEAENISEKHAVELKSSWRKERSSAYLQYFVQVYWLLN